MANEIWCTYEEGLVLYALIWRKTDDKVYDVVAAANTFDTYTDADIDTYDLVLANAADSDYYSVDFPTSITTGVYRVQIMRRIGGAIDADADVGVFQGEIYWDGTAEVDLYTMDAVLDTIAANTGKVVYGSMTSSSGTKQTINAGSVVGFIEDPKL
jgi:hypothetical protein